MKTGLIGFAVRLPAAAAVFAFCVPYIQRRTYPKKVSLYFARFNRVIFHPLRLKPLLVTMLPLIDTHECA